ncbi:family 20 glycosyl hydrolase [Paenibacillus sp. 32O-W]|uniref:family 20 glycosylhydrolase n=1 Tax=Paenibacillus sp. 32O-W TaxID=1695218 RepID=UPI000721EDD2|nr:family 20 glycosylhydrolase [Paenibacillus sp. 32O-W]ALS28056.1 family 20 glycosyl hydrolase [Paenibacillus sp. 32O-W]
MKQLRGFHMRFGSHEDVGNLKRVIRDELVPLGVNVLVLECNTSFVFESHPEVSGGTLTKQDARELSALCKENGIRLIPLFECLGHQGWGGSRNSLLRAHPEFDETPYVPTDAKWPDFYCPSWCPSHPDINPLVFDLMDELLDAFEADALHVGMDEVFAIADDQCPRCRGKNKAELFADAANAYYDHLTKKRNVQMLMWADRLIDAKGMGYSQWDGDVYGIWPAVDRIPKDVILCDWHYDKLDAYPSIGYFLDKGFTVWPCCWKTPEAALDLLEQAVGQAKERNALDRMPGMLVTGWNATGENLVAALFGDGDLGEDPGDIRGIAATLRTVMKALDELAEGATDMRP